MLTQSSCDRDLYSFMRMRSAMIPCAALYNRVYRLDCPANGDGKIKKKEGGSGRGREWW